jgi:hypothetical protein
MLVACLLVQSPLFSAAAKEDPDKATKAQLKKANTDAFDQILDGNSKAALTTIEEALSDIPQDRLKDIEKSKEYLELLQTKGSVLLKQQNYDEADKIYTVVCPRLTGSKKKECTDTQKIFNTLKNTTIEFVVANPGPKTIVYLDDKEFCFLSDNPANKDDLNNCNNKKKIKARAKAYKVVIKRDKFEDKPYPDVTIVLNNALRVPETGELTLKELPATVTFVPYPPTATIVVDGQAAANIFPTNSGKHDVTVSAQGYLDQQLTFITKEGAIFYKNNQLKPDEPIPVRLTPYVTFNFNAPNTTLYQNGSDTKVELLSNNRLAIEEGSKPGPFIAKAPGFKNSDPIVIPDPITPGMPIPAPLQPLGVPISLKSPAPESKLSINGLDVDLSKEYVLTQGAPSYDIIVSSPGYEPLKITTPLEPGIPIDVVVDGMKKEKNKKLTIGAIAAGGGLAGSVGFAFLSIYETNRLEGKDGKLGLKNQQCIDNEHPEFREVPDELVTSDFCKSTGNKNQIILHRAFVTQRVSVGAAGTALAVGVAGAGLAVAGIVTNRPTKGHIEKKKLEVSLSPTGVSVATNF